MSIAKATEIPSAINQLEVTQPIERNIFTPFINKSISLQLNTSISFQYSMLIYLFKLIPSLFYDQSTAILGIFTTADPSLKNFNDSNTKQRIDTIKQKVGFNRNIHIYKGDHDLIIGGIQSQGEPFIIFNIKNYSQNTQDFLLTKRIIQLKTDEQLVSFNAFSKSQFYLGASLFSFIAAVRLADCTFPLSQLTAAITLIAGVYLIISSLVNMYTASSFEGKNTLKNDAMTAKIHGLNLSINALNELKTKSYKPSLFEPSIDKRIEHLQTLKA